MSRRRLHRSFFRLFATFCSLSLFCSFYVFYGHIRIINDLTDAGKYDNTDASSHRRSTKHFPSETLAESNHLLARNVKLASKEKRRALQEFFELNNGGQNVKVTQKTRSHFQVYLGCEEIRQAKVLDEVGHGYTKSVQKGVIAGEYVAVKSVLEQSKDFQHCLNNGPNYTQGQCFNLVKYKLAKEIILLQQLKHQNIVKLLGFCWQNEVNSNDIKDRGLSMVTELGEPLKVLSLLQTPWQERLRICLGLARLIAYLKNSPLGSLIVRDFRHHQFILVSGEIKLTDLDDVDNEARTCTSSAQCVVGTKSLNWTLPCVSGYCLDFNAAFNLINVYRFFLQHVLVPESPQRLKGQLKEIVTMTKSLQITSEKLVEMLESIVEKLRNGYHVIFESVHIHEYTMIPEADFPALHDYNCEDSRTQTACELNVHSLHEAKYDCSRDTRCLAFVVTRVRTWVGFTIIYLKSNTTGLRYNKNTSVFLKILR